MSGKKLTLFFFSIFILFSSISLKSQEGDSLYYINTYNKISDEIFSKKMVMLGDYDHIQPGPFNILYNVLTNWLKKCESKDSTFKLTYIIESDELLVKEIKQYILLNDPKPLISKALLKISLEDLEYLTWFKQFSNKIDSINKYRKNKISFDIEGFEDVGILNNEMFSKMSKKEQALWFVNERDSITAARIINYVGKNPDRQILMFYGTAHLLNGYVYKYTGSKELTEQESMGFYLAHYLKKMFGDQNIITFLTMYNYDKLVVNPELASLFGVDFITTKEILQNPWLPDLDVDFIYICNSSYIPNINVSFINSNFIVENFILIIYKYVQNYSYLQFSDFWLDLYRLTGKRFENYTSLKDFLSRNEIKSTEWLFSEEFDTAVINSLSNYSEINYLFSNHGISVNFDTNHTKIVDIKNTVLKELLKRLKFTNSIGIYWFGYPDEKIKAKEYLVKFSGEDFAEPEKYLQWYRMKYYGYEY